MLSLERVLKAFKPAIPAPPSFPLRAEVVSIDDVYGNFGATEYQPTRERTPNGFMIDYIVNREFNETDDTSSLPLRRYTLRVPEELRGQHVEFRNRNPEFKVYQNTNAPEEELGLKTIRIPVDPSLTTLLSYPILIGNSFYSGNQSIETPRLATLWAHISQPRDEQLVRITNNPAQRIR